MQAQEPGCQVGLWGSGELLSPSVPQFPQVFSGYNNGSFFTGLWGDLGVRQWKLLGQAQHRVRTCGGWCLVHRGRVVTCTGPDTQRARSKMCRFELCSPHNLISLYTNSLLPGSVHTVLVTPSPRAQGAQGFWDRAHPARALGLAEGDSGRPGPPSPCWGPSWAARPAVTCGPSPRRAKGVCSGVGMPWVRIPPPPLTCTVAMDTLRAIAALFPICEMGTVTQRPHRVGMSIKRENLPRRPRTKPGPQTLAGSPHPLVLQAAASSSTSSPGSRPVPLRSSKILMGVLPGCWDRVHGGQKPSWAVR